MPRTLAFHANLIKRTLRDGAGWWNMKKPTLDKPRSSPSTHFRLPYIPFMNILHTTYSFSFIHSAAILTSSSFAPDYCHQVEVNLESKASFELQAPSLQDSTTMRPVVTHLLLFLETCPNNFLFDESAPSGTLEAIATNTNGKKHAQTMA
jgi:hypothetical protein